MATNIPPAEPFAFSYSTLSVSDSLDEDVDAWEGMDYTSEPLPSIGSQIDTDWAITGQPPGLDIDSSGVVYGTVECGIFKTFVESIVEERNRGSSTITLGDGEYPSPYEVGSGTIIKKDFDVTVSGYDTDPDPSVYVEESYIIRVGKNMECDIAEFDAGDWWDNQ